MNIEPSSAYLICGQLSKEFKFGCATDVLAIGAIGETLRASILVLAQSEDSEQVLTSTQQSIRWTHRRLKPLFPGLLSTAEFVATQLEKLNALGEIVKLDGHRIAAGPTRRIWIDSNWSLLLGGGPLDALSPGVQAETEVAGLSRVVKNVPGIFPPNRFPLQRLEDWLQLESDDMVQWSTQFIKRKLERQSAVQDVPDGLNIFFRNRWMSFDEYAGGADMFLARRKISIYGNPAYQYSLVNLQISRGVKVISGLTEITKDERRILQGGIRTGECVSQPIYYSDDGRRIAEIKFCPPLAPAQRKLLGLGWEVSNGGDAMHDVRHMCFNRKLVPLLSRAFGLMGYTFSESTGG